MRSLSRESRRLEQVRRNGELDARHCGADGGEAGDDDDREVAMAARHAAHERQILVARHLEIGEEEIELLALCDLESLVAVLRDGDFVALGAKELGHSSGSSSHHHRPGGCAPSTLSCQFLMHPVAPASA
jgi:hypothetical protein